MICAACESEFQSSPVVSCILLFAPGLQRPYPLIPSEEYTVCMACNAIFEFVQRAAEAHASTREATVGPWSKAIVVFDDGAGSEILPKRSESARA